MITYLIKSILCSGLFILAYYLFLEKERTHTFKRFYLLVTVVLSLVIPTLSIEAVQAPDLLQDTLSQASPILDSPANLISTSTSTESSTIWVFIIAYAGISIFLLCRFIINILAVIKTTKDSLPLSVENTTVILVHKKTIPHTFLNYIFISVQDMKSDQILKHELTHARQWHSVDIIFIELIHCVFWFNPALLLFKKAIRLNHEFLADESVLKEYQNVSGYQQLLLDKVSGKQAALVSTFNYSITKKRFTMMTTVRNPKRSMIRIAAATLITLAVATISINVSYSQAPGNDEYTIYKDGKWQNQKLTVNPAPVGGRESLMKSFQSILTYPKSAKTENIQGDVAVMFEVNAEGKITACKVIKQLQQDCDAVVLSALKTSTLTWKPAELNGKKYVSRFVLPVTFSIGDSELEETFDRSSVQAKSLNTVYMVTSPDSK